MIKKILIGASYVIIIGLGVFGTLHFKNLNDNQVAANTQLNQQMAAVQTQLDSIGALTSVFEVQVAVDRNHTFTQDDLKEVSVPTSTLGDASITDASAIIGMKSKLPINLGTVITQDMLMEQGDEVFKYYKDITLPYLPIYLKEGDYFDVSARLINGESIPILTHKEVLHINDLTVTVKMSPEEQYCWQAAMDDYALFSPYGFQIQPSMYIEPGIDTTVAFYPVALDSENMVKYDVNISDYTRCVNTTLRQHIDLVNSMGTTDTNSKLSPIISQFYSDEAGKLNELRQQRIEEEEAAAEAAEEALEESTEEATEDYSELEGAEDIVDLADQFDSNVIE